MKEEHRSILALAPPFSPRIIGPPIIKSLAYAPLSESVLRLSVYTLLCSGAPSFSDSTAGAPAIGSPPIRPWHHVRQGFHCCAGNGWPAEPHAPLPPSLGQHVSRTTAEGWEIEHLGRSPLWTHGMGHRLPGSLPHFRLQTRRLLEGSWHFSSLAGHGGRLGILDWVFSFGSGRPSARLSGHDQGPPGQASQSGSGALRPQCSAGGPSQV